MQQKRPDVYPATFVSLLARNAKVPEDDAKEMFSAFIVTLAEILKGGGSVCFPNFGVFEVRKTAERMGRNPRTMEEKPITARQKPVFRASQALQRYLNPEEDSDAQESS